MEAYTVFNYPLGILSEGPSSLDLFMSADTLLVSSKMYEVISLEGTLIYHVYKL